MDLENHGNKRNLHANKMLTPSIAIDKRAQNKSVIEGKKAKD